MKQFEPASLENYHRPVVLLGAAAFCVAANMRLAEPLIPRIAQEFSATVGDASVVSTAFALAYGITQLICGPLGDRYGKFRMVSIAMTLAAIVVFAASLVQSLTALALIRLVAGAAAAAIISLGLAYVADIVPYDRRQAILARILTGQLIGVVFGQAAGAMIIEFAGWRVAFAILGSAFALVAMALWIELRSERVNKVRNSAPLSLRGMIRQYLAIAESSHSRLLLLAVFAEGFLFFGALAYFGAFLRSTLAIDYFKIGLVLGCFGLGGLGYSLFARLMVSILGEQTMIRVGGVVVGVCVCSLPLLHAWIAGIPLMFAIGFGLFMLHNTLQTKATEMALEARGSAISLFTFFFFMGQATGVATLGIAIDQHGYAATFIAAGVGLLSFFLFFAKSSRTSI